MTNQDFFHITIDMLKDDKIFPFNLHIFNPGNKKYNLILHANSPLTDEKVDFFKFIVERHGMLAVSRTQCRTFLRHLDLNEADISSLAEPEKHDLEIKREEKIQQLENEKKSSELKNGGKVTNFKLTSELENALNSDDFSKIIEEARKEISIFSIRVSVTTSLAAYLAETLLVEDNFINRIVAISYFFAKNCDITNELALGNLVCAGFFHHLGHTQIDYSLATLPHIEMSDKAYKQYKKHSGLAGHLIKKSQVELSDSCMDSILEHHERYDGSGYPQNKVGDHIEMNTLILAAISHIFEYSKGHVTGSKKAFHSVITNLKNKNFTPGLEFEFGDKVYDNLITLINKNSKDDLVDEVDQAA